MLHISEVHVAHLRVEVPVVHRVDGLRQLGAAAVVDAAGVDPDAREAVLTRDRAAPPYLVRDAGGDGVVLLALPVHSGDQGAQAAVAAVYLCYVLVGLLRRPLSIAHPDMRDDCVGNVARLIDPE